MAATVFVGNIDDDPLNADWVLNANRLAAAEGYAGPPADDNGE